MKFAVFLTMITMSSLANAGVEYGAYDCNGIAVKIAADSVDLDKGDLKLKGDLTDWLKFDDDTRVKVIRMKNSHAIVIENNMANAYSTMQLTLKNAKGLYSLDVTATEITDQGQPVAFAESFTCLRKKK